MALTEHDRLFIRSLTYQSFYHFVKIIGGYSKCGADASEYIHRPLCEFAQDRTIFRKQIIMPRDWRKSTIFTRLRAIWEYIHNPNVKILIVSENALLASRNAKLIHQLVIKNDLLRWVYPQFQEIDYAYTKRNLWNMTQSVFPRDGIFAEATLTIIGVGGAAQGGHYDIILVDDACGKAALESPIVLEKTKAWFSNTRELLVHPATGEICVIGTHWFPGDFPSYVREEQHYETKIIPALKISDDRTANKTGLTWIQHPNVDEYDSNFPESLNDEGKQAFTKEHYQVMEKDDPVIFWTQHMNMPDAPNELTKFDARWLKYCHIEDRDE
jgi:hypothetical protein